MGPLEAASEFSQVIEKCQSKFAPESPATTTSNCKINCLNFLLYAGIGFFFGYVTAKLHSEYILNKTVRKYLK